MSPPAEPAARTPPTTPITGLPADLWGLLEHVRDDTVLIRASEQPAYLGLLAAARQLTLAQLEREADRQVTYTEIVADPTRFRGRLIGLEGEARRIEAFPVPENPHGITQVFEVWFFNRDGGDRPLVFHCTALPPGLSPGDKLHERIRVTGFFFKRYQYLAQRGLTSAPMFLGRRLRWFPPPPQIEGTSPSVPYVLGGLTAMGLALAGLTWWLARGERRPQARAAPGAPASLLGALDQPPEEDLSVVFRQLADWEGPPPTSTRPATSEVRPPLEEPPRT